jgi:probable phosphoglycerate mutase
MPEAPLKRAILDGIARTVARLEFVQSATVAGSFTRADSLEGISDIDTIVIVDRLDERRFNAMRDAFRAELSEILRPYDYRLVINATLGPLKFNDARTAVLHLMPYSAEAHREHVINSPFTCLDWQRSPLWHKQPLSAIYPVFGLQPHHFINARRGTRDYLNDFLHRQITYRELSFQSGSYQEIKRQQPMTLRDRHEFGYHILRFLMQNVLKLIRRCNDASDGETLCHAYFAEFPDGAETFTPFFLDLRARKQAGAFLNEVADLDKLVIAFVEAFERQFRTAFEQQATRHLVYRHAPTERNAGQGEDTVFQGNIDPPLAPLAQIDLRSLADAVRTLSPRHAFASPLRRSIDSVHLVAGDFAEIRIDERLREISYGACEGRTLAEARRLHPDLFAAWQRGEDPAFPGGANSAAVLGRVFDFAREHWQPGGASTVTCTHNVVLRCLVGHLMGVPQSQWHRLRVPHLAPIELVSTRFGLFVDLHESVERRLFEDFFHPAQE